MLERLIFNWPLKLLSLALAFGIWVSVTGEKRVVQDFSVPLEIRLPEARVVSADLPNVVTVRLRGPESLMRRIDPIPFGVNVDLLDAVPGPQEVQLIEDYVDGVPRGVDVEFIDPERLSVDVETRAQKELTVEPTFLGQPPTGFAFYGARVTPERMIVDGPASAVEKLEILPTNPIRLDQRRHPFTVNVGAVPGGAYVHLTNPRPIQVHVDVYVAPVERRFESIPAEVRGQPAGAVQIRPEALSVVLTGPPSVVDQLAPGQIHAIAEASGLRRDGLSHQVPVTVEFVGVAPDDAARLTVKSLGRREVSVRILDGRAGE